MDVTDQAESSARLAASEEHFRVAFDNAPIGMSMISLAPEDEGRYLRTNAAFQQMLGRSHEELHGVPLIDLTHEDDRIRDAERFGQLVRGRDVVARLREALPARRRATSCTPGSPAWWCTARTGERLYLITHAIDISDRLREQAELERLALTDTLTGLANRTLLNDRLDQGLARLHRTGGAMAMLLLDVDRFKTVNDSLGHQVGDELLVQVASRIEAVSRADTTVARLGGDEFVVLVEALPSVDAVHAVAARLLQAMRRPFDLGASAESQVATVSIGVSVATDATRTPGDLYREADLALYRAKDGGRDQYALFDDELRARADQRLSAERMLRRALADSLLVPVFQPIIDLKDGRIHAAEALVRIQDGDTLILPAEFIDVAEETGLIVEVDARMFERVAAEGARLLDSGVLLRRLTTNVSARSLEDPMFVGRMRRALTWYGVPGSMIRVELTERSLLTASPDGAGVAVPDPGPRASPSASTTSAPATRHWRTCSSSRCSSSRSTARSSAGSGTSAAGRRRRRGRHRPRPRARPGRRRRGCRDPRAARRAAPDGLRPRAGLPHGQADARLRAGRAAAHRHPLVAAPQTCQRVERDARVRRRSITWAVAGCWPSADVEARAGRRARRASSAGRPWRGSSPASRTRRRRGRPSGRAARRRRAAGPARR